MPETDILNPTSVWDEEIQDSMCPDYGFTRKRTVTQVNKKAVGGTPYSRETRNTGHAFSFSWLNRSWECVRRLKRYYEQYEDGFFTIVDWDGGGRHYVGRFTSEVIPVEVGNNMWSVQNVLFEEMPQVPMLKYPNDWEKDAIRLYALNDFGDQKLATSGTWTTTVRQIGLKSITTFDNAGTVGDWAQYEYRGYGFRLWLMRGAAYGVVNIALDGVSLVNVDCYSSAELGPQIAIAQTRASLDIHRVKMTCLGNGSTVSGFVRNPGAPDTALAASWAWLEVMR